MQVSFNPLIKYSNNFSGLRKSEKNSSAPKIYTEDELKIAKTKKAISEFGIVAVALGILYFGMKHNFKINHIKAEGRRLREIENIKLPENIGKKIKGIVFPEEFLKI